MFVCVSHMLHTYIYETYVCTLFPIKFSLLLCCCVVGSGDSGWPKRRFGWHIGRGSKEQPQFLQKDGACCVENWSQYSLPFELWCDMSSYILYVCIHTQVYGRRLFFMIVACTSLVWGKHPLQVGGYVFGLGCFRVLSMFQQCISIWGTNTGNTPGIILSSSWMQL